MRLLHVVGNRPQFIKLSPFLKATEVYTSITNIIIHSGQHYDYEMSKIFFDELGIPEVDYNLEVGSGGNSFQIGKILVELEPILLKENPDVVVVYGDTNTTLAGALAAYQQNIPLAHVESGMREHIWRPEEINKKVADHCSRYCFCPTMRACENLKNESINPEKIFFTGDITYDAFLMNRDIVLNRTAITIPEEDYILMTMHRAETVDIRERVKGIVEAILESPVKVIFAMHPRTKNRLADFGLLSALERGDRIEILPPVGYFEFLRLLLGSKIVVTDSSGVLKEAFYAEKLCVTVDDSTEYREIFDLGYNVLAGTEKASVKREIEKMLGEIFCPLDPSKNPFGQGNASSKMVSILLRN